MDLSKLPGGPRKDDQPAPPAPPVTPVPAPPSRSVEAPPYSHEPVGGDAWISVVIGIIVLFMQSRFLSWIASTVSSHAFTWTFRDEAGQPLSYPQSLFFIIDLGLTLFGAALILDGIVLLTGRRILILIGLSLTAIATLMNIISVIYLYPKMGFQIMPALAVAIGGYLVAMRLSRLRAPV